MKILLEGLQDNLGNEGVLHPVAAFILGFLAIAFVIYIWSRG